MKILLGYKPAEDADYLLDLAKIHAKAFNATILAVSSMIGGREVTRYDYESAEEALRKVERYFLENQIPCETRLLVRGLTPGEDLVQAAKEAHAYEIVIGVKRRSKVGKLLFGSTTQHVILHAPCPVVTA